MNSQIAMDATIVICTYNRADSLSETIRALRDQVTTSDRVWEVIVVDNNSCDGTRKLIEGLQADWPRLRYEFEGKQGLSHARNHGIRCSVGRIVLFTDDDVIPEPGWLEATLDGIAKYEADACGGFISPIWEASPPAWLTERFYGFLAVRTDREDDYVIEKPSQAPFGANMAFRRTVFDRVGLFDTSRGRKGKVLASGEDGEMFERVLAAGLKAVFLGGSRVHHKVEAFRMTKRYIRRWRMQTSRNIVLSKGFPGERRLFNVPLFLFPQLARAVTRMIAGRLTGPADEAFYREVIVFHFLGTIQGLLQTRCRGRNGMAP